MHDLRKGIPHESETVDAIYSSHMLEHLDPRDAERLLAECHRVLVPGGTLRVVVPDLEPAARAYLAGDRGYFPSGSELIADAFVESFYSTPGHKPPVWQRLAVRLLRNDDGGHKWMYDAESLSRRFTDAGFVDVRRVKFREGRDPVTAQLDTRSPQHVHLEGFKPTPA